MLLTLWASSETITNPLGLDWPWELVHLRTNVTGPVSVRVGGELRPAQSDGSNVWFIATLREKSVSVALTNTATPSPLTLRDGVIANGIYEYRLKPDCGSGLLPATGRDQKVAPTTDSTSGLFRVAGDSTWYGRETPVTNLQTEVVAHGPVFITVRQTAPGYERTIRFVAGDPWIDVTEQYDMYEPSAHWIELKDGLRPDTVFWVPWFLHGGFEPSGKMQTHPLHPQNKQGDRPFVTLSPRWNQQPGGGMDFFVTRSESKPPLSASSPRAQPIGDDPAHRRSNASSKTATPPASRFPPNSVAAPTPSLSDGANSSTHRASSTPSCAGTRTGLSTTKCTSTSSTGRAIPRRRGRTSW